MKYLPQVEHKQICRIKTGQYTGDDTVSQSIIGIGFRPKRVEIILHAVAYGDMHVWVKTDQMAGDFCGRHVAAGPHDQGVSDRLISLDDDGFTVDDQGANGDPNKGAQLYDYTCWG